MFQPTACEWRREDVPHRSRDCLRRFILEVDAVSDEGPEKGIEVYKEENERDTKRMNE